MHAERHDTGAPRLPEISRRGTDASPSFGDRSSGAVLLDLYRPYWRHLLSRHITTGLSALTNRQRVPVTGMRALAKRRRARHENES